LGNWRKCLSATSAPKLNAFGIAQGKLIRSTRVRPISEMDHRPFEFPFQCRAGENTGSPLQRRDIRIGLFGCLRAAAIRDRKNPVHCRALCFPGAAALQSKRRAAARPGISRTIVPGTAQSVLFDRDGRNFLCRSRFRSPNLRVFVVPSYSSAVPGMRSAARFLNEPPAVF